MKTATGALLAAALFFAGVLVGGRGASGGSPAPGPVILRDAGPASGGPGAQERNAPLEVEEVPHEVNEGNIEEYEDNSGPGGGDVDGSDDSGPGSDDSGPGSDDSGPGSDDSGPGSDDSGPGSDDSGPGSGDSGPGADGGTD
jgi:hypothetical protein